MGDFFAKVLELFSTGNRNIIFRLVLIIGIILLISPFVLNYFYGNTKLEQEIRVLKEFIEIDERKISDERLKKYYDKMLNSIVNKNSFDIYITVNVIDGQNKIFSIENIVKFISGSFIWIIIFFFGLTVKMNTIFSKITFILYLLLLVLFFGFIGVIIPSINPLIVNIIGFPFVQIIFLTSISIIYLKIRKPS
jgi:hypothetical protein